MLNRYFLLPLVLFLFAIGCGNRNYVSNNSQAGFPGIDVNHSNSEITWVDGSYSKFDTEEDVKSSFFFLNPHVQAWKTYYYIEDILRQLPDAPPGTDKEIPVVMNERVLHYMRHYQNRGRRSFSIWLARSGRYLPSMKKVLAQKGLPTELVYLAMIESGFNVTARSHKAAVGPWQFIKPTATRYGLRVDNWVDERRDPEKSTYAAASYLSDLYAMFHSWELAAAGYNCGEDRVQAAIDKYQINDFWQISEYTLPTETKNYVPKIMAALVITRDPEKYGFVGIDYHEPEPYEKASVAPQKSLDGIAKVIGTSPSTLKRLNPALINNSTPPGTYYSINVPLGYASIATERRTQIAALSNVSRAVARNSGPTKHKVRRGDTLGKIAGKYKVSVKSIKRTNGLKSSTIRTGQVLVIPGRYTKNTSYTSSKNKTYTVQYKVKSGDTLGSIAATHRVSISDVKGANNINGSFIRSGQKLTIPGASGRYYDTESNSGSRPTTTNYTVKSGDTLGVVAAKHKVSVGTIKKANNLSGSTIRTGQVLAIPYIGGGSYASSNGHVNKGTSSRYKVKSGDTLGGIAQKHGVQTASIRNANNIKGSNIHPGQTLTIPSSNGHRYSSSGHTKNSSSTKYTVKSGDTLGGIAQKHGVRTSSIQGANSLKGSTIRPGQKLVIPNGSYKSSGSGGGGIVSYKVQKGDSLWEIASKHDVTVSDIKKWNNLHTNNLSPGKKLTIYK